jgi:hypothetical protein
MNNNDVFKHFMRLTKLRRDLELVRLIFDLGEYPVTNSRIRGWQAGEEKKNFCNMPDEALECFLNGMYEYRNKMEDEGTPVFSFPVDGLDGATFSREARRILSAWAEGADGEGEEALQKALQEASKGKQCTLEDIALIGALADDEDYAEPEDIEQKKKIRLEIEKINRRSYAITV